MTTTSTTNKVRAQGNGVTTVFPAAIKIFSEDDIEVTIITRSTNVVEKTLVLNDVGADGYTIDFNTEDETVTVTVNTAPTITQDIQQFRILSQTQETSFPQASKFPSDAVENALDKTIMILQDQQEALGRALKVSPSSLITQLEIPDLSGNAGRVLVPSASEDGFEYRTILNTETITNFDKDVFSGTGAQTEFVLSQAVSVQNALEVFVDNVRQEPGVDYTATGTTLTFTVAPDAGTGNIFTIDNATSSVASVPADASVTTDKLFNGAVTNEKIADDTIAYGKIDSDSIGDADDIAAGTASKLMSCAAYNDLVESMGCFHIQDQKAAGTDGGTFTQGADQTRDLNTVVINEITGASLASNQITLPAGTYKLTALCPAFRAGDHRAKLYNVTDGSEIAIGTNASASNPGSGFSQSVVKSVFTLASAKVLEVRHRCSSTFSTSGFGTQCNFGSEVEVYTDVFIEKLS